MKPGERFRHSEPTQRFFKSAALIFGGLLLGLAVSKYSIPAAFKSGYETAFKEYGQHYTKQVKYFSEYRNQSCMRLWFNDKQGDLNAARMWMCQYTNRDGSMK
jgi:hypothetical protein